MPVTIFEPIEQTSVVKSVVEQVETLILTGVLRDGARLPAERDLAVQLGVSRPKIREAFKILESNGLITAHHGEGTFVSELIGSAMSPALIELYSRHQEAFLDYLEFRAEQEGFAAGLAAARATTADKEILTTIVDKLEAAHIAKDTQMSHDADIHFHAAIIDASHNSLLIHTMSAIYSLSRKNLFYNRAFLQNIDGVGELLLTQHRNIYEAILEGNSEQSTAAAHDHISFVRGSYLQEQARAQRDQISARRLKVLSE